MTDDFPHFDDRIYIAPDTSFKGGLGAVLPVELRHFPHVPQNVRSAKAKFIGAAGEYLVDSVLTRHGLTVWNAPDLNVADRLINFEGQAVLIQIKTVTAPRDGACRFSMTRGNFRAGGVSAYQPKDFHIAALVVLSSNVVKFVPNWGRSFSVSESEFADLAADPLDSLELALSQLSRLRRLPRC